ncbi:hypothetical protein T01_2864 [Trichinella spiralis]|uniref:Uncharacterized protein n=1 Tax=Trichinella spiralis TaxID=6334 RepID=A0A0V1BEQ8_TRISP|nr:hypothetical protein T01_2864 [Trichinella spiralis]
MKNIANNQNGRDGLIRPKFSPRFLTGLRDFNSSDETLFIPISDQDFENNFYQYLMLEIIRQ